VGGINIHRVIIPPSPQGGGVLIQAQYTLDKNIVSINRLQVYNIINGVVGSNIEGELDIVSRIFVRQLIETDLNEGINNEW